MNQDNYVSKVSGKGLDDTVRFLSGTGIFFIHHHSQVGS